MVQIRVGDVYLDLYEFDPPKLNFAIEDITDTSTRSEFTRTFRVPATANNNSFFETAFEVNGQDFDVTVKIPAELMVDGVLFRTGELRLTNIYVTRENEKIDYECVYYGVIRSLATSIGAGTLNELDLSAYDHALTSQNIVDSWQAYPEGGATDGFFNGDIIYPLIDHGNTYDEDGNPNEGEIRTDNPSHAKPFTNSSVGYRLERERFKPMIRAKAVWDAIFEQAGFTYTSNFINSASTFNQMYVPAFGNTASITNNALQNTALAEENSETFNESTREVVLDTIILDPSNNFSGGRYVVPQTGTYKFRYSIFAEGRDNTAKSMTLRIYKFAAGSTLLDSISDTFTPDEDGNILFILSDEVTTSLTAGDEIYLNFSCSIDVLFSAQLEVLDAPGEISIAPLLSNEYKQIDFVKDIITKFRLVMAPDKTNPTNFISIEPWSTYIASGDEFDWTDKLDVSKDFRISPLFYTQSSRIEYRDSEGGDYLNTLYQQQYEEPFGTLRVLSNNELLKGDRKIETQLIPVPVMQIEGAVQATKGMDNTIIPQLHTHSAEDVGVLHEPVVGNKHLLYYNGIKNVYTDIAYTDTWYMENDLGVASGFTDYPMVSPYEDFPILNTTLDLNWQREDGYIKFGLQDTNKGASVYDAYWSPYINSLYNKWARRVTAYFVLNAQDLIDFSFDDVIFVKDTYYYVEKIYDVPLGEKSSVKVDLIKLLNR
jgi:hypothetical protein